MEKQPPDPSAQRDFYRRLRARIDAWAAEHGRTGRRAQVLLAAPDLFHLLCRLGVDPRVPRGEKARLAGAIAYFVSPIDLLPEALLGPIGYLDDVALAALVLNRLLNRTPLAVVQEHWAGRDDVLLVIQQVLAMGDELLGQRLWGRLRRLVGA